MTTATHTKGVLFATLAALCWGIALVASKGVLNTLSPVFLLLVQLLSSVVFTWCLVFLKKIKIPALSTLKKVSSLGLLEPFLTYILVLIGLTYARATDAALLQSLESIFIIIIAALFFKEKITLSFTLLSCLILLGLYLSIGSSLSGLISNGLTGNLLIVSGILSAAFYVVLTSRSIEIADAIVIVACQQTVALLATIVVILIESMFNQHIFTVPPYPILLLAMASGILQYAFAFIFYLISLKHINAGLAGMFLNLVPVFGILGAYVFLDEKMHIIQIVGSLITLSALLMMSRLSNKSLSH